MKKSTILGFAITSTALAVIALATLRNITLINDTVITENYNTITISGNGTTMDWIDVDGAGFTAQCIKATGQYIRVHGFIVEGCPSHAIKVTGQNILIENNIVRHNVTENGTNKCGTSNSWGSGIKAEVGSQFVTIYDNDVYQNCGEGIASTMSQNVLIENNRVWDNFSVGIYVDNSNDVVVKGNITRYTGDSNYFRNAEIGKGIMLGAENYSSYGWTSRLNNISILNNILDNCKGITYWNPTNTVPVNILIQNNLFSNVKSPIISISGGGVVGNITATPTKIGTAFPSSTPTITRTPTPTWTKTQTPVPSNIPTRRCIPVIGTDLNGLFCY